MSDEAVTLKAMLLRLQRLEEQDRQIEKDKAAQTALTKKRRKNRK